MAYASLEDLIALAGRDEVQNQTDRDGAAGDIVAAVAEAALEAATAEIDGWLSRRFVTPLNPVPPMARDWTTTTARYRLWLASTGGPPEHVRAAYQDARRDMQAAADGRLALPAAVPPAAAPAPGGGVKAHLPPRQIGPRRLGDFLGEFK